MFFNKKPVNLETRQFHHFHINNTKSTMAALKPRRTHWKTKCKKKGDSGRQKTPLVTLMLMVLVIVIVIADWKWKWSWGWVLDWDWAWDWVCDMSPAFSTKLVPIFPERSVKLSLSACQMHYNNSDRGNTRKVDCSPKQKKKIEKI